MSRLPNQPESYLLETIAAIKTNGQALKQPQTLGPKNIVLFINQSASTYDFSTAATNANLLITFTAAKQQYAFADLFMKWFGSNGGFHEIHPNYTPSTEWPNPVISKLPSDPTNPLVTQWKVSFGQLFGASETYYIKPYVHSTDQGTITGAFV